jgi:hypothetical protein
MLDIGKNRMDRQIDDGCGLRELVDAELSAVTGAGKHVSNIKWTPAAEAEPANWWVSLLTGTQG